MTADTPEAPNPDINRDDEYSQAGSSFDNAEAAEGGADAVPGTPDALPDAPDLPDTNG